MQYAETFTKDHFQEIYRQLKQIRLHKADLFESTTYTQRYGKGGIYIDGKVKFDITTKDNGTLGVYYRTKEKTLLTKRFGFFKKFEDEEYTHVRVDDEGPFVKDILQVLEKLKKINQEILKEKEQAQIVAEKERKEKLIRAAI